MTLTWADATAIQAPWHPDSALDYFERSIEARGDFGCWMWLPERPHTQSGHGRLHYGLIDMPVHRFSFELHRDEIPYPLVLDHLCHQPPCANPWHLDPVTRKINDKRGWKYPHRKSRRRAKGS